MDSKFFFAVVAVGVSFSLVSCSESPSGGNAAWSKATGDFYSGIRDAGTLQGVEIPILRSPAYKSKWRAPLIRTSAAGDYELNYANPAQPFDRLAIQGSPRPFPKLAKAPNLTGQKLIHGYLTDFSEPQPFRSVTIEGQTVRWFQESTSGGADGAYYSTEGFALTDSTGKTGYYRLVVEAGDQADREVSKRFASVKIL